jgi:hypothetical protein
VTWLVPGENLGNGHRLVQPQTKKIFESDIYIVIKLIIFVIIITCVLLYNNHTNNKSFSTQKNINKKLIVYNIQ